MIDRNVSIGRNVSQEELLGALKQEEERRRGREELTKEFKNIKPGECLAYIVSDSSARAGLVLMATEIKGLKWIIAKDKIYIYREKK